MRGQFFLWLFIGLIALAILYFLFLVLKAFYVTLEEMWTNRELTKLADEYSERRRNREEEARQRLNNGCQHLFDDQAGALPPDVCCHCGLAKTKPDGDCDHVWRIVPGIIPRSKCEICEQEFCRIPT